MGHSGRALGINTNSRYTFTHTEMVILVMIMIKHSSSSSDGMFKVSAGISNLLLAPEVFNTCLLAGW